LIAPKDKKLRTREEGGIEGVRGKKLHTPWTLSITDFRKFSLKFVVAAMWMIVVQFSLTIW
jgi:hypothetical protein